MELITLKIDTGQMMVKTGGLIRKGLAPFSGKVLAIFEEINNIALLVKLDGKMQKN